MKRWTKEEDNLIIEQRSQGVKQPTIPGRSESAVRTRVGRLINNKKTNSFHKSERNRWSEEEVEKLKLWRASGISLSEIAERLERTYASVDNYLRKPHRGKNTYNKEYLLDLVRKYKTCWRIDYCRADNEPSSSVIKKVFGSWNEAIEFAGLDPEQKTLKEDLPTILYLVDFKEFRKVGITQRSIEARFRGFPEYSILDSILFECLEPALLCEQEILLRVNKVTGNLPNGNTECFSNICTELSEII